jgi:hypothetical protein
MTVLALSLEFEHGDSKIEFLSNIGLADVRIAGTDPGGADLYRVHYSGVAGGSWLEWCSKLGYRTIGSGSPHASVLLALEQQNRRMSIAETLYNVYCAKKSAELAPGVRKATDLAVVHPKGIEVVGADLMRQFEALRHGSRTSHVEARRLKELYEQRALTR